MVSEELKGMLATVYERFKYLGDDPEASQEVVEQLATLKVLAHGSGDIENKPLQPTIQITNTCRVTSNQRTGAKVWQF